MIQTAISAIATFVVTNIDYLFLLTLFFSLGVARPYKIVVGQLLGFAVLVGLSALALLLRVVIPMNYIALLGLIPLGLGVAGLITLAQSSDSQEEDDSVDNQKLLKRAVLYVAGLTIANGGDNIGVYAPFFATLTIPAFGMVLAIYFSLVLVWCSVAHYVSGSVKEIVEKHEQWIKPVVLMLLGIWILFGFFK